MLAFCASVRAHRLFDSPSSNGTFLGESFAEQEELSPARSLPDSTHGRENSDKGCYVKRRFKGAARADSP